MSARLNALPISIIGILFMGGLVLTATGVSMWSLLIVGSITLIGVVGEVFFAIDDNKDYQKEVEKYRSWEVDIRTHK